ncbi:ABC transporter ATP-binding protein [Amycolatopsis endophytica]|uniref:ABC-type multidrug transport system ATPase subunit n=1 Tax=Amycolatopsis endophytica TaxID=860233 RepID=A0A853BBS8_9PSEU|nr:ATP-binding cassette domain-containing protein [Amycolatopsis endophytica]NYI92212.1 ABC-type multidrug transport system ATPase subunit [Amycolatopsis endophytica]
MRVHADRVTVDGPHGTVLPPTSLTVDEGELAFVHGEPGAGITAFGLALTGRMKPATGLVTVDGKTGAAKLRAVSAVVDAPGITAPEESLPVRMVVAEECSIGKLPAGKDAVARWLDDHDLAGRAGVRFEHLSPAERTRLLTALAAARPGVGLLVLDTPDRHTSDVDSWAGLAKEYAGRGFAVVVLTATAPPEVLPAPPVRIGQPETVVPEGDPQ